MFWHLRNVRTNANTTQNPSQLPPLPLKMSDEENEDNQASDDFDTDYTDIYNRPTQPIKQLEE